jgi:hypothetical protein
MLLATASSAVSAPAMGWRGDGTGKYPTADPPITWGRISTAMKGLRYLAGKPKGPETAAPMPDGVIRQWLILGPVPIPKEGGVQQDALPNEAALAPDENQRTGQWVWKKASSDAAYLDFTALIGRSADALAYACAYVYSETSGPFRLNLTSPGSARVYVNGKAAQPSGMRFKADLIKGWNCLILKIASGEADWFAVPVLHGWGNAQYEETNIAWRTPLPGVAPGFYGGGMGVAAPVIAGDRLYVLSEPHDLVCLNKADGRVLWVRRHSYFEAATEEDRKHPAWPQAQAVVDRINGIAEAYVADGAYADLLQAKAELEKDLQKELRRIDSQKYARDYVPDIGFSGFTPSTDGRLIYVWSASGVTACYDLDGNRRWIRLDRRPAVEHGFSSSPLLVDGKLVVFMRDLMAFDARTGELAWLVPLVGREGLNPAGFFHGSPVAVTIGGAAAIALGNGAIVRAADGSILFRNQEVGTLPIASPVAEADSLYQISAAGMRFFACKLPETLTEPLKLPTRAVTVDTSAYPKYYMPWHLSSPVIHEGLAYLVNNSGVLTVLDVQTGRVAYQRMLDLDPFQWHNEGPSRGIGISPALAGEYLYFIGNNGAAVVIEPGRAYKQVAKNKIESVVMAGHWSERQERFVANPVFDGKRLYIRGEGHLYAIGPR